MPSAKVLSTRSTEKPEVCINGNCTKAPVRRGACEAHYSRWKREAERRRLRKRNKELDCPPNGMGVIMCAVCGRRMSEHRISEWCAAAERFPYSTTNQGGSL